MLDLIYLQQAFANLLQEKHQVYTTAPNNPTFPFIKIEHAITKYERMNTHTSLEMQFDTQVFSHKKSSSEALKMMLDIIQKFKIFKDMSISEGFKLLPKESKLIYDQKSETWIGSIRIILKYLRKNDFS